MLYAIILLAVMPAFADTYCDQGEKLYKKGDYKAAAKYFAQSLQASPSSRSLYYSACCFLKGGDTVNAQNSFKLLVENYPQSEEAQLARTALQSLSAAPRSHPTGSHSATVSNTGSGAASKPRITANDPLTEKLISVFRHDNNTEHTLDLVKDGLSKVPPQVKEALANDGYQIVIAPMTMDVTNSQDSKPRGYNNGGGWDNAGGVFLPSSKQVVVGERVSWRSSLPMFNNIAGATVRHEIGHAYDQYLGRSMINSWTISSSPLFRQTYASDAQNLSNTQRSEFEYFVQPDGAGENELFAELFYTHCLTGDENTRRSKSARDLAQAFPKTFRLVEDLIAQRGMERFSAQE